MKESSLGAALVLLGLVSLLMVDVSTAFTTSSIVVHSTRRHSSISTSSSSSALHGVVDVGTHVARDVGGFQEWAHNNGVQTSDGFQLTSDDGSDIYVMTTTDIPAESPVLYVPQHMIFSANKWEDMLSHTDSIREAEQALQRYDMMKYYSEFALYVYLLTEVERGEESPWYAWFNSLPRIFFNGASMTAICYECLPPFIASLSRESRAKMTYFNQALQLVDDSLVSETTKLNKELANWVFHIVDTRSFPSPDGDVKISPMADMFNHGTDYEAVLSYDEEGNCYAYAVKDVPAGSPVRISYGDPTNPSQFLGRYGFLDETSPASFCKIMIDNPTQQLVNMGYDPSRMLFYKDTGDVSQEVYDVLLYQILDREDRQTQYALYEAHLNGDEETKMAIHQHYADKTLTALSKHVNTFLTQLNELSAKGVGKDVNEHPRLPLIMRHNEFVKETFQRVQARLQEMGAAV